MVIRPVHENDRESWERMTSLLGDCELSLEPKSDVHQRGANLLTLSVAGRISADELRAKPLVAVSAFEAVAHQGKYGQ